MAFSENAVCSKAKSMYGKKLTHSDYDELCKMNSIREFINYLKMSTDYRDALKDLDEKTTHRRLLEIHLMQEQFLRNERLMRYAGKKHEAFYNHSIMMTEISTIITELTNLKAHRESQVLQLPSSITKKFCFNPYELMNVKSYGEFLDFFSHTKYSKVLHDFVIDKNMDINALERGLITLYYDEYFDLIEHDFKGKIREELKEILLTEIEIQNICKIYRLKQYYHLDNDEIKKTLLIKYSRMSEKMIDELLECEDGKAVIKKLSNSKYRLYSDKDEYVFIEYEMEKVKYNLARRYMYFSSSAPVVFMTYEILLSEEISNLKHIIEGIRYKKDPADILNMVIEM